MKLFLNILFIINGISSLLLKTALSNNILDKIKEGTEITEDIIEDFIHEILKMIDETQLFNSLNEEQKEEINQLIRLMNKTSIRNKPTIVSAVNELKFGKEKFLEDDIILEKMIADANISKQDNESLLDFSRVGYSNVAQNYLIEYIYTENKKFPVECLKELQTYKIGGFFHYANLLRGNFSEIEKTYIDQTRKKELSNFLSFKHAILIPEVVKQIISLQGLMKRIPERKYDIVINRIEATLSDSTNRIETAGFLSFSSSDNIEIVPGQTSEKGIDYYKMILPKDMMCLPIELINEETVKNAGFQCEFLMPYFSYDILSLKDDGENRKITIGNPKVKDIRQLLLKRLRELQEFAKDNPKCTEQLQEDIKEAIDIVEKSLENESNNIGKEKNVIEGR